jgi:hypothetical protein
VYRSRPRPAAVRLLLIGGAVAVLAGCGSPPQALPTAPPESRETENVPSSTVPSVTLPAVSGLPTTGGLPPGGVPTLPATTLPTYPVPTRVTIAPTTRTTPSSPPPSPAGTCTSGPTGQQVLAAVKGRPGIPDADLAVDHGPFCSGSWQYTEVKIAGKNDDEVDPLLVVTTGRPSALKVVEAGADVCSDRVQDEAPPGIRVRVCGS